MFSTASLRGFTAFGALDSKTRHNIFGRVDGPSFFKQVNSIKVLFCKQNDNKGLHHKSLINNTVTIGGKQGYCNVSDKGVAGNDQKVDPSLFAFQKWGITWNAVGLYVASLVGCYWNIFTEDGAFALVLVLQCYVISLIFRSN